MNALDFTHLTKGSFGIEKIPSSVCMEDITSEVLYKIFCIILSNGRCVYDSRGNRGVGLIINNVFFSIFDYRNIGAGIRMNALTENRSKLDPIINIAESSVSIETKRLMNGAECQKWTMCVIGLTGDIIVCWDSIVYLKDITLALDAIDMMMNDKTWS